MTTTLSEGVKVPDVGSVNWAGDLEINWNLLNGALANLSGNVKLDRDNIWTGEQSFTLPIVGSITGTASKAIADEDGTSIKTGYVNVAGNQTVSGDKSFTGSNTFNNILPNATNSYSLGSSSYQWSSVYAQTYYYNGTAWGLDKENTWTGANTYTNTYLTQKHTGLEEGELPASAQTKRYRFTDKNNASLGWLQHRVTTSGDTALELLVINKFSNGQLSTQGSEVLNSVVVGLHGDGSRFLTTLGDVYPDLPGRVCNLGTSTNKWKTLNGINPGALGMPDASNAITIDTTGWTMNNPVQANVVYINNSNKAPCDGWLYVNIKDATNESVFLYNYTKDYGVTLASNGSQNGLPGRCAGFLPVSKGDVMRVYLNTTNLAAIKFFPCLGNV